jgi:eukaryotic-like serine/threonine-protein kinase
VGAFDSALGQRDMNITAPLQLRSDVLLVPVAQLSAEVRAKIDCEESDYAVSRLHGRMPSQVIDHETASLLQHFRQPTSIVDAVIRNSRELSKDPRVWLDELLPAIGIFLRNQVLAPAGEGDEPELRPRLDAGMRVGGWEVLHCANLIEDSELHRVQRDGVFGALKFSRNAMAFDGSVFANEAAVLRHLDGVTCVPRLLDRGEHEGRPWLVEEWREGVDAGAATSYARHDREKLFALSVRIAEAYAELHARGVVHADVHPRNVLIARSDVTLIDFGLSRIEGSALPPMPRGGMYYFFEPEYLESLYGPRQLEATLAGEQYALAALLYLILTGKHYLDFRLDREEMMRQSRTETPLPFAARGVPPWPEVEAILRRALEKDPSRRFASVQEMLEALRAVELDELPPLDSTLLDEELTALQRDDAYPLPPHASINYGAAGAAIGLLRIAEARGDAALLARAEVWRMRGAPFAGVRDGWYSEEHDVPEAMIGKVTPYHTAAGLHAAAAMIAWARADSTAQQRATRDFLAASNVPCSSIDLTLGRSGTLLACAFLAERKSHVRLFGDRVLREIWEQLDALPPLAMQPPETYLGTAHGWSGYLYATLRWCRAAGTLLPASLERRLHELASQRVPRGRGAYWPRTMAGGIQDMMAGWCNGAAGHVFTWTAAYDTLRDERWLDLARDAAWNAWEEPLHHADLCCGSAGRAYALLDLYQHTGERKWLSRACHLAGHAAGAAPKTSQRAHALWKGELGVAVLLADLEDPGEARMPFFG